ncbi:TLD domain-containing protein 2 isoform X1 [Vigna radiata var. radiata]|uniref:Oxidation resistance protein 1 n=1 Tax=Vigna radiata var. radiata TaxID=3916 RepID=A0A1S3UIS8_VIGRR|nr:TLD domain-containing protein 2 isoform X1 [Vigna radiata var. radiata]
MGKEQSFRSKAAYFVSDLATVLLNPISDSKSPSLPLSVEEGEEDDDGSKVGSHDEIIDGPDTSSFTAFLYSLLSSSDSGDNIGEADEKNDDGVADDDSSLPDSATKESFVVRRSLFSRGRHSLGWAIHQASKMGGFRSRDSKYTDEGRLGVEMKRIVKEPVAVAVAVADQHPPAISEPSMLVSNGLRDAVYASLPAVLHGRKWLLLYSTSKHGISLSTLYRRSMLWPGVSLLVVGDRKGAVFGGVVEAPLRPSNKKKYQGTNNSFVFTDTSGCPVIYRPTGVNRYFTLCSTEFLAIGGGGHFALYLEGDLLNGSSSVSETYGNPCLAHSQEFEVKGVELWGFVFPTKYEEMMELIRTEAPGICRS